MDIIRTNIPDVLIIKPKIFADERGSFYETYHKNRFRDIGIHDEFVQDNESTSQKNVLRGLHMQKPPYAQGKLVRVIKGSVLDVVVDLRIKSAHYGQWVSTIISSENKIMFWVPAGFAHGFLTLEDDTVFSYKCTQIYNKDAEMSIRWDDPTIAVDWGIKEPLLSPKDKTAPLFSEFVSPF